MNVLVHARTHARRCSTTITGSLKQQRQHERSDTTKQTLAQTHECAPTRTCQSRREQTDTHQHRRANTGAYKQTHTNTDAQTQARSHENTPTPTHKHKRDHTNTHQHHRANTGGTNREHTDTDAHTQERKQKTEEQTSEIQSRGTK